MNLFNFRQFMVRQQGPATTKDMACCSNFFIMPMKNDKGAVLVIALMLLAIMTLLGVAALNTTTTEIKISGNDKVYKQAFYNAEAGISYAVQVGTTLFPSAPMLGQQGLATPADLAAASPGTVLQYTDNGGSPRRVEVRSTGNAAGGGVSVIIAGIIAVVGGAQAGPGALPTGY